MVNFGPLAAEIISLVWGTPANFNGFLVLAAVLHGNPAVGVSQSAVLNRGRHLYPAARPSRWASAHILVIICISLLHYFAIQRSRLQVCSNKIVVSFHEGQGHEGLKAT